MDENVNQSPFRRSVVPFEPSSVPKRFVVRCDNQTFEIEARQPYPITVVVRGAISAVMLAYGLVWGWAAGWFLILGGALVSVHTLNLFAQVFVRTCLKFDRQAVRIVRRRIFGNMDVTIPLGSFKIVAVDDLFSNDTDGPDQAPVHYLRTFVNETPEQLFVGFGRKDLSWVHRTVTEWLARRDAGQPGMAAAGLRPPLNS